MGVKFSVRFNLDPHMLDRPAGRAADILAQQAAKDTEQFVPASEEKSLSNRTIVAGNKIIYPGPYARYLYHGKLMVDPETGSSYAKKGSTKTLTNRNLVFQKSTHSKAQAYWFEASKAVNLDKWTRVYDKAVKGHL